MKKERHYSIKMNGKKIDREIVLFYLYRIFSSCLFSRGIFMLYLTHKGLDIAQVGLYQMLMQGSMFAFEIPTGYIGDKIGKVKSLQIGALLLTLHCVLMVLFRDPAALILLGVVEGIGYTFVSGSDSALLYELLKTGQKENEYLKLNANLQAVQSILIGVTIWLGAVMISFSWSLVYFMTAVCLAISWALLFAIKEPAGTQEKPSERKNDLRSKIKSTILYPDLLLFVCCIVGFSCFDGISGSYYNYNQIIFERENVPVSLIGFFFSAAYLASSAAYTLATWLAKKTPPKTIILRMMALQGLLFAVLAVVRNSILFVGISFVCCLIPEVVYILADSIIQRYIASEYRATMLSIVSMLRSLITAVTYSVLGSVLNKTDVTGFMCFLALVTFGSLGCFGAVLAYKKKKVCR